MIKNDRQLTATLSQRDKLHTAMDRLANAEAKDPFVGARIEALKADIQKLDRQVAAYRKVVKGDFDFKELTVVAHLGEALVEARIATGLTQKQLASRLGKKAQQIQRYERDFYATANLQTLKLVAAAIAEQRLSAPSAGK